MSSVRPMPLPGPGAGLQREHVWLFAGVGYAAMYLPIYLAAARPGGLWHSDDHAHGALVLLVIAWLFWRLRRPLAELPAAPAPGLGWPLLLLGLLLYAAGRIVGMSIFEFGSQMVVVAAVLLLVKGPAALRLAWFPVLYFVFMVPLPGPLVDAITGPLKQWISVIVVESLWRLGYPISRSGVVLNIGQYQMLVADACSGLHSMYSLTALGTLFMHISHRAGRLHNAIMLASILPIAFAANVVRVLVLVLITYHFGDAAGQGFLHGAAGMVLMLVALACFFALDAALARALRR